MLREQADGLLWECQCDLLETLLGAGEGQRQKPPGEEEHCGTACASVGMGSTLLWGQRAAASCVKGKRQHEQIGCLKGSMLPMAIV